MIDDISFLLIVTPEKKDAQKSASRDDRSHARGTHGSGTSAA
jgi:hypothetical protein